MVCPELNGFGFTVSAGYWGNGNFGGFLSAFTKKKKEVFMICCCNLANIKMVFWELLVCWWSVLGKMHRDFLLPKTTLVHQFSWFFRPNIPESWHVPSLRRILYFLRIAPVLNIHFSSLSADLMVLNWHFWDFHCLLESWEQWGIFRNLPDFFSFFFFTWGKVWNLPCAAGHHKQARVF